MVLQMCRGFMKGDRDLAYDLAQDVFINVWNALPRYRAEASYKTWIYRITVNTCLLQIRKDKNRIKVPLETVASVAVADTTSQAREDEDLLYWAIGQLEEVDRLIIMMVLDEVDQEEAAQILGLTQNNLRVKTHRIKTKLKTLIENERQRNG
ncbi:MAG: sigma-70 family RNA polymerase sigma factor [Cytophagales bacterium]|nr:sigma-70 family RNA polymerase sigma factor [Cytophagales bacterium]HCR52904.1 RNA polymerase subunit sigma-24 [Cytophagales bacterium]